MHQRPCTVALSLCNVLYFSKPSHRYHLLVRAAGAGIGTSLLHMRKTKTQRKWLSQGHTAQFIAKLKIDPRFLSPYPGLFLIYSAVSFILGLWTIGAVGRSSIMLLSRTDSSGNRILKEAIRNPQTSTKAGFAADDCRLYKCFHLVTAGLSLQNRVLHCGLITPYLCFKIMLWCFKCMF